MGLFGVDMQAAVGRVWRVDFGWIWGWLPADLCWVYSWLRGAFGVALKVWLRELFASFGGLGQR